MTAAQRHAQNQFSGAGGAAQRELTGAKHLAKIAEILANGLMRVVARKSSQTSALIGESSVHISRSTSADPLHVKAENQQ